MGDQAAPAKHQMTEPLPAAARADVDALFESGELFRYGVEGDSPVTRLERTFAEAVGAPFALAVNSCSSALFLSLKALGLEPGARVIIPAFTFAAVPSAVIHADCVPVLVETGPDLRLDLDDFTRKFDDSIDAVLISHMRGHISDMDAIKAACDARGVPLIEDAAHALGATWRGRQSGLVGRVGCFSFQSHKLLNAGEGGILVTADEDIIAQTILLSGAYEHNWTKHPVVSDRFAYWQNRLPHYNMRMNNLSAAVVLPQVAEIPRRVAEGRARYGQVAAILSRAPWFDVPRALPHEHRAPDSIQFGLVGFEHDDQVRDFIARAAARGVKLDVFGLSADNARAFWNWKFLPEQAELPKTRALLMRSCDLRLPPRMNAEELDVLGDVIVAAAAEVMAGR
ncbi:DegT/DnrJ/EryC1/StrS family aminotransferase [Kordiimonas marina]|uniref:DegT/DnrJ/EryC1/StrS family aminotransferase n=1 Tax=Kordiimonas marina TaxID=2872312 RepID=UPI003CCFE41F